MRPLTMQLWASETLAGRDARGSRPVDPATRRPDAGKHAARPPRQLEFPYAEGFAFAQQLHDLGGYDAINAALSTAIPASTEQILHPEKYLANEAPIAISLPDQSPTLNEGNDVWSLSYAQTMGELVMQVWAAGSEAPPDVIPGQPIAWPHADSVDGWGGDRLNMYEGPNGAWIID